MRIPHHHTTTLAYCRELGVAVEPFCVGCDSTFLYQQKAAALTGRRIRVREARTDLDGYVAELLSKAVSERELDLPLSKDDRERLLEYLRRAGALDEHGLYRGSSRRGYEVPPGPGDAEGRRSDPLPLLDLLASRAGLSLQADYPYQPTMLQVVGGMDRLPAALAHRIKDRITYRAAVREIRQSESGISAVYADREGRPHRIEADYCVCTIPLPVLATLQIDASPEFRRAVQSVTYAAAGKIGMQFRRRFWEEDDGIYGGASRTDQDIAQIVYPSWGFHDRKGILIGYYVQGEAARPMGERTPAERLAMALEQGARIHPQYGTEFETAFSVGWHRVVWNRGSWASFNPETRRDAYPLLIKPQGRLYLAGDHLTHLNAWMNGAFESARAVATAIHARAGHETRLRVGLRP
jgi:monoamine oxidase